MDKDFYIKLTNSLYHLTLLFPKKEPLRYKMRELADDILANPTGKNLDVLDSFFEVAKSQNWVSASDVLEVQKDYSKIKEQLKSRIESEKTLPGNVEVLPVLISDIPPRQGKILSILKERGRAQVWEIQKTFPEVTKRTLRRDFENLLKQGSIERMGERNDTFYQLKD